MIKHKIKKIRTKIKIGDQAQIITGKYKNQINQVKQIIHKKNTLIIQNINIKTKHYKSKQNGEPGQIKQIEAPIHISNIKILNNQS